jgi:hypothetical protein
MNVRRVDAFLFGVPSSWATVLIPCFCGCVINIWEENPLRVSLRISIEINGFIFCFFMICFLLSCSVIIFFNLIYI